MLIYPKPSELCELCQIEKNCSCECHKSDVINSKHYEIHREESIIDVKSVVDLDHYR